MITAIATFAGSLIAILALAALVRWLGLGQGVRIVDEAMARQLGYALGDGFIADEVALDKGGGAALLKDSAGRYLLLRRHGAHFLARPLTSHDHCRLDRQVLIIAPDNREPPVTLQLGAAAKIWAARFRNLGGKDGARPA